MTFDKFTIKAQEAVQAAVNIAQRNGQQTIEPVHLLSGIIEKAPDVTNYIFQKLGMNGNQIAMLLQQEMQHLPRVQGAGQPYLSGDTNQILLNAEDIAKKMGDEFVSVEPILLAILKEQLYRCPNPQGCRCQREGPHRCHPGFATGSEREEPECRRELSES